MKKNFIGFLYPLVGLLVLAMTACTLQPDGQSSTLAAPPVATASQPAQAATGARSTYTDPFAYCSAVGTIDAPDSRYTGDPLPNAIIQGYLKAAGLVNNGEPVEILQKTTIWRCMDNSVYVCNFGANLPCDSQADTNKNPTQAMQDFCKANPDAGSIPMSVTGHASIFSWSCVKDTPKLLDQIDQVDSAGYLVRIWYKLPPNP
jgi:hypothetical protein